jgi:hypothetical protein
MGSLKGLPVSGKKIKKGTKKAAAKITRNQNIALQPRY